MTNNYSKIENLVENYFSLKPKSLQMFKDSLRNPPMTDKIKEFFKNSNDNRLRFEIDNDDFEYIDMGWSLFKETFKEFIDKNEHLIYQNFKENKISIKKNIFKLKKAVVNFYTTDDTKLSLPFYETLGNYIPVEFCDLMRKKNIVVGDLKDEDKTFILEFTTASINKVFEMFGTMKLPDRNLEVVVSRNYTDWFLCSTENNWTSCLNLKSNYAAALWSGLPGTIVDPNRILIYITDGTKKEYRGITADKMLQRTWALQTEFDSFSVLRWYDSKKITNKKLQEIIGLDIAPKNNYWEAKESYTPLYFNSSKSCMIYFDNSIATMNSNGEISTIYSENGENCVFENGELTENNVWWFESTDEDDETEYYKGLEYLIENNYSLSKLQTRYYN